MKKSPSIRSPLRVLGCFLGPWLSILSPLSAQPLTWSNFVGQAGSGGSIDGSGSTARFNYPGGVAMDATGTLYVADTENHTIRKITPAGIVSTLAGSPGLSGSADGSGSAGLFKYPDGVAVTASGTVYVADTHNSAIRKITPAGVVTTFAGNPAQPPGSTDATGTAARFTYPGGVAVDANGNVYVTDSNNHTLRKITSLGVVTTLAGSAGNAGSSDGTGSAARFSNPDGIAVDASGNLYVSDTENHTLRKITPAGVVTTLAGSAGNPGSADGTGSSARFNTPGGIAVDSSGTLYLADAGNHTIRKITPAGVVTTLGGQPGTTGSSDGMGPAALFTFPWGIAINSTGVVFALDGNNHRVARGALPEIAVEQPTSTNLVDGSASISLGAAAYGTNTAKTFTLKNLGNANLTGIAVTKDGTGNAHFIIDTTGMLSVIAPGSSTTFTVTFAPTGTASSTLTAALHIASTDADENPFDIALTGQGFSTIADVDGDGLNDWGEYQLSALGFNWQVSQPSLVTTLFNGAPSAGLNLPTQLLAQNPGSIFLYSDPVTKKFKLTLGLKKSTNLQNYTTLPMTAPATSINGSGNFEYRFTSPEPGAYFRVQLE